MLIILIVSVFENLLFSPIGNAMGNADYSIPEPVISFNPASCGFMKDFTFSTSYRSLYSTVSTGRIFLGMKSFGFNLGYRNVKDLQNETVVSISQGIPLGEDTKLGYTVKGFYLFQSRFGNEFTYGIDIGVISRVWELWYIGGAVYNVNRPTVGKDVKYSLPTKAGMSVSYKPYKSATTAFGFEKEFDKPTRFLFGQEFIIGDKIALRTGFHSSPFEVSFGIGINAAPISVNFSYVYNSSIEPTYTVGAGYR